MAQMKGWLVDNLRAHCTKKTSQPAMQDVHWALAGCCVRLETVSLPAPIPPKSTLRPFSALSS